MARYTDIERENKALYDKWAVFIEKRAKGFDEATYVAWARRLGLLSKQVGAITDEDIVEAWEKTNSAKKPDGSEYDPKSSRVISSALKKYEQFIDWAKSNAGELEMLRQSTLAPVSNGDSDITTNDQDDEEQVFRDELISIVRKMIPYEFEKMCGEMMEAVGYKDIVVTRQSNDQGIDITAKIDILVLVRSLASVSATEKAVGSIQRRSRDCSDRCLPMTPSMGCLLLLVGICRRLERLQSK